VHHFAPMLVKMVSNTCPANNFYINRPTHKNCKRVITATQLHSGLMSSYFTVTWFFLNGFIALININHTCKLQNCSLINQFTTVSLQLHAGEFDLAKITAVKTNTQYTKNTAATGHVILAPITTAVNCIFLFSNILSISFYLIEWKLNIWIEAPFRIAMLGV
jgi:hypothetical protein